MASRAYSTLVPEVLPLAPGCPTPTVITYIRDAAIEACERTLSWRRQIGPFLVVPPGDPVYSGNQGFSYPYDPPANSEVHAVIASSINGSLLEPLTLEDALYKFPKWANASLPIDPSLIGTPSYICQINPTEYVLLPMADDNAPYYMTMFVALKPMRNSTGFEESIFNELQDVILHNTLQRLLIMPNQNWSDREGAAYHAKQYLFKLSERRARANLGNARGKVYARMQPFS